MKYSNPTWEPYFKDLSPILSKLYFLTNSGTIRYIVATMIFKKMSFLEWRNEHWTQQNTRWKPSTTITKQNLLPPVILWIVL